MRNRILILLFIFLSAIVLLIVGYFIGFLSHKNTSNLELSRSIYNKALLLYKNKKYDSAIKHLEVANEIYKIYDLSIKSIKKLISLDENILKEPSNYNLLIERGDVQNISSSVYDFNSFSITSNYCGAIEDYTKALVINDKISEVYIKRAQANKVCTKDSNYKTNIVSDYKKAIELTKEKNAIIEELADWYLYNEDDALKALKYYSQIDEYDDRIVNKLPPPNENDFNVEYLQYVPFKKIHCYKKIRDYEKALSVIDEIIDETSNDFIYTRANNLKFLYNIKTGKFKKAVVSAQHCDALVCKAVTLLNYKKRS